MTRLEKYLLSMARDVIDAETTNSRYFMVDNLKIRLSDHISNNSNADLQIIIPYNGGTLYTVILKGTSRILAYNAKEIAGIIPFLLLDMGLKAPIRETPKGTIVRVSDKIELAKSGEAKCTTDINFKGLVGSKLKVNKLGAVQRGILSKSRSAWNAQEINNLLMLFSMEFRRNDGINEDFQIFLTCTSVNYLDVLNVYKTLVIDNNITKPTIGLLQKAYSLVKEGLLETNP